MVKNISRTLLLLLIAWIWLPTGPTDVLFIPFIIETFGTTVYTVLSILLIIYIYKTMDGVGLSDKLSNVRKELKRLIK